MPMQKLLLLGAALVVSACGPRGGNPSAPAAHGPLYEADVTVLEAPGKPAMLCWSVATSLPPQCGDIPTSGWSWDDVDGEEHASGVTWGSYHVVGRYDGDVFTMVDAGPPQPQPPRESDAITSPCATPADGWAVPDPARAGQEHVDVAVERARTAPDHAGVWITYLGGPPSEQPTAPGGILLNAAFTGDVERHRAELAEVWGGPLCVVEHARTLAELTEIQTQLLAESKALRMLSSGTDEVRNRVVVDVIFADAKVQAAMDARYGKDTVRLSSALRRVD
jgi:hypothetical protein